MIEQVIYAPLGSRHTFERVWKFSAAIMKRVLLSLVAFWFACVDYPKNLLAFHQARYLCTSSEMIESKVDYASQAH